MAQTLAEYYLNGRGGSTAEFHYHLKTGQRLGQAFFNALSGHDQERLRGTKLDPFHMNTSNELTRAIEFLLLTE